MLTANRPCACRFIRTGTCNSYILTWFGLLPMQLSMTSMAVINVIMVAPVDPSPRQLYHHLCLQEVTTLCLRFTLPSYGGPGGSRSWITATASEM